MIHARTRAPGRHARGLSLTDAQMAMAVVVIMGSLVLASLAALKEPSRRSRCEDNLRRLMQATLCYADEHQGKGPIRGWFSYTVAESSKEAYGWGGRAKVMINLGLLYPGWIGNQHDMLYCPSTYQTMRDRPSNGSPGGGWKTVGDATVTWSYGSYNYAVPLGQRLLASPDFTGPEFLPAAKWSSGFVNWIQQEWQPRHPGETFAVPDPAALMFDMWIGGLKPVHGPGVNVMYGDGHLRHHDIGGITVTSSNPGSYELWYQLSRRR